MTDEDLLGPQTTETVEQVSACRRLCLMILRNTIIDYVLHRESEDPDRRNLSADAEFWFRHPKPDPLRASYLLSFPSICEILEVDADTLRARVFGMKIEDLKRLYRFGS